MNPTNNSDPRQAFLETIAALRIGELSPLECMTKMYELQRNAQALLATPAPVASERVTADKQPLSGILSYRPDGINEHGQPILPVGTRVAITEARYYPQKHYEGKYGTIEAISTYSDGNPDGFYFIKFDDGSGTTFFFTELRTTSVPKMEPRIHEVPPAQRAAVAGAAAVKLTNKEWLLLRKMLTGNISLKTLAKAPAKRAMMEKFEEQGLVYRIFSTGYSEPAVSFRLTDTGISALAAYRIGGA